MSDENRPRGEGGTALKKQDAAVHGNENSEKNVISHVVISAMNVACHAMIIGITIYFLYQSFRTYSLFSWHPACMTIGALMLMAEAIMAISQNNVLLGNVNRQNRVRTHWILQVLATCLVFSGFIIEVVNKARSGRPHFVSAHAILGLTYVILVAFTNCGGASALFSMQLSKFTKPAMLKLGHFVLGIVTFAFGVVTLILGVFTRFFENAAGSAAQIACTVILVLIALLTLLSALKSVYYRFKSLCR